MAKGHKLTSCLPIWETKKTTGRPSGVGETENQTCPFVPAVHYESLDRILSPVVDTCRIRKRYWGAGSHLELLIILVEYGGISTLEQKNDDCSGVARAEAS